MCLLLFFFGLLCLLLSVDLYIHIYIFLYLPFRLLFYCCWRLTRHDLQRSFHNFHFPLPPALHLSSFLLWEGRLSFIAYSVFEAWAKKIYILPICARLSLPFSLSRPVHLSLALQLFVWCYCCLICVVSACSRTHAHLQLGSWIDEL